MRVGGVRVELVENGPPVEVEIPDSAGVALAGTGFVDARPLPGTRLWSLKPQSKVGAVAVPGLEVHVAPKIPISRVVFLLEHTRAGLTWRGDHVELSQADDLLRAVVEAFERITSRALKQGLRHRLMRLGAQLADVTPLAPRQGLEPWQPTRLNARLHHALHLAEVIVRHASFELTGDGLTVTGFVVNLAKVFEDFLCAQLGPRLAAAGGRTKTQDRWHLDVDRQVAMAPDLVWYADGSVPTAVIDAKYKAEKPAGFPDADLYQMLAYCTALQLPVGHLVYAKGNEAGRTHHVAGAGITIRAHTLDLSQSPARLVAEIDTLAESIIRSNGIVGVSQLREAAHG